MKIQMKNHLQIFVLMTVFLSVTAVAIHAQPVQTKNSKPIASIAPVAMAALELGKSKYSANDFYGAINELNKAIGLVPDLAEALYFRGTAYLNTKNFDAAVKDFDKCIQSTPKVESVKLAKAHHNRAMAYDGLKNHKAAIEGFTQAINLYPAAISYNARGGTYSRIGDFRSALADYIEAVRLAPNYALPYYNLADTYLRLGDFKAAILNDSEAIRLDPKFVIAYLDRGRAYSSLGDDKSAIRDYNEAIRLAPEYSILYYNRAISYINLRQFSSGVSDCTEAIRLEPDNKFAYNNRAIARWELGDRAGACEDYKRSCSMGNQIACQNTERLCR